MPYADLPRHELEHYRPTQSKAPDFDDFWAETRAALDAEPVRLSLSPVEYPVAGLSVSRGVYNGFAGAQVSCLLLVPEQPRPVPGLVFYHGYAGHHDNVADYLGWALQGYAVLAVDVRGQLGETSDPAPYQGGHAPGFMSAGILDPHGYYYRYVYADAVRAVDALASLESVDAGRIGVAGASQGGGLSLAVAALHGNVCTAMAGVPFLCHFRRAIETADGGPYLELVHYLHVHPEAEDAVLRTLRYVDVLNLADRVTCPTLVTVALRDPICPASTVYGVYNLLASVDKRLDVYPYGDHSVGLGSPDTLVHWAAAHLR